MQLRHTAKILKAKILRETSRKRPTQVYILAGGLVLGFFLLVQSAFGAVNEPAGSASAPTLPVPKKVTTEKVENFQLADSDRDHQTSSWATVTQVDRSSNATVEALQNSDPEPLQEPNSPEIAAPEQEAEEFVAVGPPLPAELKRTLSTEQASLAAKDFYSALDRGDHAAAYDKLSADFRRDLNFEQFERGYQQVESLSCEVKHRETLTDQRVRLDLQLEVMEAGTPQTYFVTCLVDRFEERWLLSGVVQLQS